MQEEAVNSIKSISSKCTNLPSIEFLVNHYNKIYLGSEGKLSTLAQKNSVLKAIGLLSFNGIKDMSDKQTVFNLAVSQLFEIIKQETTESSIVMAFSQIKLWISNLLPFEMLDFFWKNVQEFKKSKLATSSTITALYDCLNCYVSNSSNLDKNYLEEDIISTLLKSSKNMASSIGKINIVTESLYSSVILLNIYKKNNSLGICIIF